MDAHDFLHGLSRYGHVVPATLDIPTPSWCHVAIFVCVFFFFFLALSFPFPKTDFLVCSVRTPVQESVSVIFRKCPPRITLFTTLFLSHHHHSWLLLLWPLLIPSCEWCTWVPTSVCSINGSDLLNVPSSGLSISNPFLTT